MRLKEKKYDFLASMKIIYKHDIATENDQVYL